MSFLIINGTQRQFDDRMPADIAALLAELNIASATVIAELDGEIIPRKDFAATKLQPGQKLELVRFVGGG